jgi:hypothetical protein
MNTYELEIFVKDEHLSNYEQDAKHHHIECEADELKENLYEISSYGILLNSENDEYLYLPGNRIRAIKVKFLEKIQRNVETEITENPNQLKLF